MATVKACTAAPTVFVNSKPIGRIGDPLACGSSVAAGSPNVFAGG
ncbi:PAAR domain-containing protein [Pseudomonas sp. C11]|nr:PAAR domain-containing protein [Pseudomonas sp. C11]